MSGITLILLDLNGVLYRYERDTRIAHMASITHQPPETIRKAIWDLGFEDAGDAGAVDAAAYLSGFGACIGYDLTEADWLAAQQRALQPTAASLAVLKRLRPAVFCAVLTNNNLLVRRHFAMLYPEASALVGDRAYVSAEFGARKPSLNVYRRCLARMGAKPVTTLFVDDSPANVTGAEAAGLVGYRYVSPEDLRLNFSGISCSFDKLRGRATSPQSATGHADGAISHSPLQENCVSRSILARSRPDYHSLQEKEPAETDRRVRRSKR